MTTSSFLLRPQVQRELDLASVAEARGEFHTSFGHLERAHVLGQYATREHLRVHWQMLRFALRRNRAMDAFGQLWRMAGAALLTGVGLVPYGNTGGSNVNGLRPMPVPEDLRTILEQARARPARKARPRFALLAAVTAALANLGACSTSLPDIDLSLDKATDHHVYRVALVPPAAPPAVNQLHAWTVRVAGADGAPVHGATFAVDGGMPQHGHGMPTSPRVTSELTDGSYRLEGMKFSMSGWWEIRLGIQGPLGSDKVRFNTVVAQP